MSGACEEGFSSTQRRLALLQCISWCEEWRDAVSCFLAAARPVQAGKAIAGLAARAQAQLALWERLVVYNWSSGDGDFLQHLVVQLLARASSSGLQQVAEIGYEFAGSGGAAGHSDASEGMLMALRAVDAAEQNGLALTAHSCFGSALSHRAAVLEALGVAER